MEFNGNFGGESMEDSEKIIGEYYKKIGIGQDFVESKLSKLSDNPDVRDEFAYWIINRKYKDNGVEVQGYTAKELAGKSRFLDGEGVFMMLIKLRENPEEAVKQIQAGFRMR